MAYYRVSSARQGESGLGLDAQRQTVARYLAAQRNAGPLLEEYTEVESGKRHTNRPQLAAAIAACKKRSATLLIAKLDRLARNVHFVSGLMESAADFVACDMPHANRLTIHIMAAMAEHEREMISQRTKAGMDAAKREIEQNGFRISRRSGRPYSKHGNPRWEEAILKARAARKPARQVAAEVAARIVELRKEGLSLRDIAATLNRASIRTPAGGDWHVSSVHAVLRASGYPTAAVPAIKRPKAVRQPRVLSAEAGQALSALREEGKSLREIAAAMNTLGITTPSGAQWHPSSVRAALLPCVK